MTASSEATRRLPGWTPTGPSLVDDIRAGGGAGLPLRRHRPGAGFVNDDLGRIIRTGRSPLTLLGQSMEPLPRTPTHTTPSGHKEF